jgi:hypothetical protein
MTTSTFTPLRAMTPETMSDALTERPTAALVRITAPVLGGTRQREVYVLHWRPLAETIAAFAELIHAGAGQCTLFDLTDPMMEPIAAGQLLAGLGRHGIHFDRPPRFPEHMHPLASFSPLAPDRRRGVPGLPEPAGWPGTGHHPRDAVPWLMSSDGITCVPVWRD